MNNKLKIALCTVLPIGGGLLLVGTVLCAVGCSSPYLHREPKQTQTYEMIGAFEANLSNSSFTISSYNEDQVKVEYEKTPRDVIAVSEQDGKLVLTETRTMDWYNYLLPYFEYPIINVYIPSSYSQALTITGNNGEISVKGFTLSENLSIKTNNGKISLSDTSVAKDVSVQSENGVTYVTDVHADGNMQVSNVNGSNFLSNIQAQNINIDTKNGYTEVKGTSTIVDTLSMQGNNGAFYAGDLTVGNLFKARSDNGSISFSRLNVGQAFDCENNNGYISGSIMGEVADFMIDAQTKNGYCNLSNTWTGTKTLRAHNVNGSINISFIK